MAPKTTSRYRNPANDIVDIGEASIKNLLRILKQSGVSGVKGWQRAGQRTGERLKEDVAKDTSLKAQLLRARTPAPTPAAATPAAKPAPVANYKDAQGNLYNGNTGRLIQAAPAAAAPAPGPTAQPSVYAPRAEQAPRPNTTVASKAAPAAPANPYAGIGDVRGNELGVMPDGSMGVDQKGLGQPLTPSDVDIERRRAFLDADNSIDGIKAVRDLLKRRKLSFSVSD